MNRYSSFVLRLLCLAAPILALSAGAAEGVQSPTPKELLDRYVKATGGKAALEKLKSRVMTGQIEVAALGVSGPFEIVAKAPNKQVSKIEFEGFGSMQEGFDGKTAWAVAPFQGARVKEGSELARVQRTTWFPRELYLEKTYDRFEVKAAARIDGVDTWMVEATPKAGKPDRLYFDRTTGLLVREETTVDTPVGEMTFQIDLSDYREVDGVKVPFSMKVPKPAELGFNIKFAGVKHNVEVDDARFRKP